jgi:hypothetical protein
MSRLKTLLIMLLVMFFSSSTLFAATFTECYKDACAFITVPDNVVADEDFEVTVEGYLEGGSSWDTTSYMFLENAEWSYEDNNMVRTPAEPLDVKGYNWGSSFLKTYTLNRPAGDYLFTFVFGSRGFGHDYYDVAVEASFTTASSTVPVAFDIKPQSCPNPLNINRKGVLSAAIIGSEDLDVTQIDPATIKVAGLSPIHFSYEDVTEPHYPLSGKASDMDCTDAGPDGFLDLTLKFRAQDFYAALEEVKGKPLRRGDGVVAVMSAGLIAAGGDSSAGLLVGEDVVRIITKK